MVVRQARIPGAKLAVANPWAALHWFPVNGPIAVPPVPLVPAGIPPLTVPGTVARSLITTPLVGVTPLPGLPIRSDAVRCTRASGVTRQVQHSSNSSSDWNTYTFTQISPTSVRQPDGPNGQEPNSPAFEMLTKFPPGTVETVGLAR